ncbi:MAG: hypothetical protein ABEJ60_02570 [Halodesulfurarchaeum sp.]
MNDRSAVASALVLFLLTGAIATGGAGAAATDCREVNDQQLCIEELTVPAEYLLTGERGNFSITVTNPGNATATGIVMLHTVSPGNTTNVYRVDRVRLAPGERITLTRGLNASTVGVHGLRATIVEPETRRRYDVSGVETVRVREEPPTRLGGPIDRTEIALAALVGALSVLIGLGYRQFAG